MNKRGSTHLSKEDRKFIEKFLNEGLSCNAIAERLKKDSRSISREVKNRRDKKLNLRYEYKANGSAADWMPEPCKTLLRFPYVCNNCPGGKRKVCFQQYKYFYDADIAHDNYRIILSDSRTGLDVTLEDKIKFDTILYNGIKKGQSIHHICQTNKAILPYSERSAYRLVDKQQTVIQSIDLRRKVKLKPRKHYVYKEDNHVIREGRTYLDFLLYVSANPAITITELDTVECSREAGHKCLLTIHSTATHFMLMYLLDSKSKENVSAKINELKEMLGLENFKKLFGICLTDRGSEFVSPNAIEIDESTGEILGRLFYCNSYSSYQKGALEENHELIRYILPKGLIFDFLSQEKVDLICSHINSYVRKSLGGCPYDMAVAYFGKELIDKTKVRKIPPDLVNLTSTLVK